MSHKNVGVQAVAGNLQKRREIYRQRLIRNSLTCILVKRHAVSLERRGKLLIVRALASLKHGNITAANIFFTHKAFNAHCDKFTFVSLVRCGNDFNFTVAGHVRHGKFRAKSTFRKAFENLRIVKIRFDIFNRSDFHRAFIGKAFEQLDLSVVVGKERVAVFAAVRVKGYVGLRRLCKNSVHDSVFLLCKTCKSIYRHNFILKISALRKHRGKTCELIVGVVVGFFEHCIVKRKNHNKLIKL